VVSAIDIRSDAQEQAKSLGAKIIDVGVPKEIAVGDGFYACSLPEKPTTSWGKTGPRMIN
jgi:NAD(P) transhydrogenase subunit alpha